MLRLIRFLLLEALVKTSLFVLVATLGITLLLAVAPEERQFRVAVRSTVGIDEPEADHTRLGHAIRESVVAHWLDLERDLGDWRAMLSDQIALEAARLARKSMEAKSEARNWQLADYWSWLRNVASGDLGRTSSGQPIVDEVRHRFPVTLRLSLLSIALAVFLGFVVGVLSHARQSPVFRLGAQSVFLVSALPSFFLGYLLIGRFSLDLSATPSLVLPVIALTLSAGVLAEMSLAVTSVLNREQQKNYVRTAILKGLEPNAWLPLPGTVYFHVFRAAAGDVLAEMSLKVPLIISASIVVEKVFSLPGLGDMLLDGLAERDVPRVLTVIVLAVLLVRIGSVLAETGHYLLDPRRRGRHFDA